MNQISRLLGKDLAGWELRTCYFVEWTKTTGRAVTVVYVGTQETVFSLSREAVEGLVPPSEDPSARRGVVRKVLLLLNVRNLQGYELSDGSFHEVFSEKGIREIRLVNPGAFGWSSNRMDRAS